MVTIPQTKEFEFTISQCPDDKDSLILKQCESKIYLEKSNIKLLMLQLILLENDTPNDYQKDFDKKFESVDLLNELTIKSK